MILVVDDHTDTRGLVVRLLQLEGYEVVGVANAEQGAQFMATAIPNLVILNGMMPGMDGLDLLRAMRTDARLHAVPVMFYSADASPERIDAAMKAGANEFIVKGTTWGVVLDQVARLVGSPDPDAAPKRPPVHPTQG